MLTLCERVCPGQSDVHLVLPKTRKPVPEQAKETPELLRALVPVGAVPCALLLFTFATEEGGISGLVLPSGRAARSPPAPPPGDAGSGQAAGWGGPEPRCRGLPVPLPGLAPLCRGSRSFPRGGRFLSGRCRAGPGPGPAARTLPWPAAERCWGTAAWPPPPRGPASLRRREEGGGGLPSPPSPPSAVSRPGGQSRRSSATSSGRPRWGRAGGLAGPGGTSLPGGGVVRAVVWGTRSGGCLKNNNKKSPVTPPAEGPGVTGYQTPKRWVSPTQASVKREGCLLLVDGQQGWWRRAGVRDGGSPRIKGREAVCGVTETWGDFFGGSRRKGVTGHGGSCGSADHARSLGPSNKKLLHFQSREEVFSARCTGFLGAQL